MQRESDFLAPSYDTIPMNRDASPMNRDASPMDRGTRFCQPSYQQRKNLSEPSTAWLSTNCNLSASSSIAKHTKEEKTMSQLPPHLRQYVDPDYVAPPPSCNSLKPLSKGPKPIYDTRNKIPNVKPAVNLDGIPPAKLTRTFGDDDQIKGVQGNTVFHPTIPAQARPYPVTGREADNNIRRMTGFDRNPQKKAPVLNPTLIPEGPEGTVPGGGRFLSDAERDAIANLNPNTIGDYMLPHIQPNIFQWQDKPVSYKKPTQQVREPILPPSNAGQYTVINDIGMRRLGESSVPTNIGAGDGANLIVDGDRYDVDIKHMPREEKHHAYLKETLVQEPERELRADVSLPIPKGSEPKSYTLIKTVNKKLQQPHTLDYGANYAASDEADYDPTANGTFSADLSHDRLRERSSRVSTGILHGANNDTEIGQSVLPTVGSQAEDAQKRVALRTLRATSSVLPGVEVDEGVGSAADGTLVGNRARQGQDKRRIEHVPMNQIYRAQNEADVEAGNHSDQAGGVVIRSPGKDRAIQNCNILDDLAYDASGRQQEGVFVRADEESRKNRLDVREASKAINVLNNFQIGDGIGEDGQGIDSASFARGTETRAEQRNVNARIREQNFVPSVHGATTFNGFNENDDQGAADGVRVGGDPAGVRKGQVREKTRLEMIDLTRRTGETGGVEIDHSVMGTTVHRDTARQSSLESRERVRSAAATMRIDDPMFEDPSSSVHAMAGARTGDGVIRAEQYAQRRAAVRSDAASELMRRTTLSDDNFSQSDIGAPSTIVRREALTRERSKTATATDFRFDECETDQAPTVALAARSTDDAARANRREKVATLAPRLTGTLVSDDLIDAPHSSLSTQAWHEQNRGKLRESAKQMKREDLWRAVIENEDEQGFADHSNAAGRVRARGDGRAGEQRLDARGVGRYDAIVETADQDFARTMSTNLRDVERKQKPGRLERTKGLDAYRLNVETLGGGGDGEGVGDSSAITMSVSSNLRELFTKHRETTKSNVNALMRGGDDVDSVYEADRFAENLNTQSHRKDRSWRDETVINRFSNPDSDVLDNPVFAGNGVGMKPDQAVGRFLLREQHGMNDPRKGRIDDIEDKFVTYTLDPGTVRTDKPIVGVKEEQRALSLKTRLRCDSPPPDNVLKTNARFRALTSGGKFARVNIAPGARPSTPQPQRNGPKRSDSPIYRGTQVCPF